MEEGHRPREATEHLSASLIDRVAQNDPSLSTLKIIKKPLPEGSTFSDELAQLDEEEELLWSLSNVLCQKNTILTSLSFADMHFGDLVTKAMREVLIYNTTLRELNLSHNFLTDRGVRSLFDVFIRHNFTLISLDLSCNKYIEAGTIKKIASFLRRNVTLQSQASLVVASAREESAAVDSLPISCLPPELLCTILSCLVMSYEESVAVRLVCREWNKLVEYMQGQFVDLDLNKIGYTQKHPFVWNPQLGCPVSTISRPTLYGLTRFINRNASKFRSVKRVVLNKYTRLPQETIATLLSSCDTRHMTHLNLQCNLVMQTGYISWNLADELETMNNLEYLNLSESILNSDALNLVLKSLHQLRTLVLLGTFVDFKREKKLLSHMPHLKTLAIKFAPRQTADCVNFLKSAPSLENLVVDSWVEHERFESELKQQGITIPVRFLHNHETRFEEETYFSHLKFLVEELGIHVDIPPFTKPQTKSANYKTPLLLGISRRDITLIDYCMQHGAELRLSDLYPICKEGDEELLRKIASHPITNDADLSAFYQALDNKDMKMLKWLFRMGLYERERDMPAPLILKALSMDNGHKFVRYLLRKGGRADRRGKTSKRGLGDPAIMAYLKQLFREHGSSNLPLDVEILEALIANGADVNDHAGNRTASHSPLTFAISKSKPLWVATLLEFGADIHYQSDSGRPLQMARKWAAGFPTASDNSRLVLEIIENGLNKGHHWKKERKGKGNSVGQL